MLARQTVPCGWSIDCKTLLSSWFRVRGTSRASCCRSRMLTTSSRYFGHFHPAVLIDWFSLNLKFWMSECSTGLKYPHANCFNTSNEKYWQIKFIKSQNRLRDFAFICRSWHIQCSTTLFISPIRYDVRNAPRPAHRSPGDNIIYITDVWKLGRGRAVRPSRWRN